MHTAAAACRSVARVWAPRTRGKVKKNAVTYGYRIPSIHTGVACVCGARYADCQVSAVDSIVLDGSSSVWRPAPAQLRQPARLLYGAHDTQTTAISLVAQDGSPPPCTCIHMQIESHKLDLELYLYSLPRGLHQQSNTQHT